MYQLTETGNDYQVDAPPPGFEVNTENVLVLQERDFEEASIEEISLVLESALNDLSGLIVHHNNVLEAIPNGQSVESMAALRNAVKFRRGLEKRYGCLKYQRFATEALASSSSLVIALEEEANDQKGFFARMIESIAKAFKWLWSKITGLFTSIKEDKEEKKVEDSLKKLKEAESKNLKPKEEFISKENILGYYGFLGEHVTPAMVAQHLQLQLEHIDKMVAVIIDATGYFTNLVKVTDAGEVSDQVLNEILRLADSAMKTSFGNLQTASKEDLKKASAIKDNQAIVDGSARKLEGFLEGAGFYAWSQNQNGQPIHAAVFIVPKQKQVAKKVDFVSSDELARLTTDCGKLDDALKKLSETVTKKVEESTRHTDQLKANLGKLTVKTSDEDKKKLQRLMTTVNAVGNIVHKNTIAASRAFQHVNKASIAFFEYFAIATAREFEGEKETKKEDKPEDKK